MTKLKIAEFRDAVYSLNWSRRDLSGSTQDEYVRTDVRLRLNRPMQELVAMLPLVSSRFVADLEKANYEIEAAINEIKNWEAKRVAKAELEKAKASAVSTYVKPHLYLVH